MPQRLAGRVLRARLTERLARGGFVAAAEEADELLAAAAGDAERLEALGRRRVTGEPLAWITGTTTFCGLELRVDPGVYVPRWQSEALARRAADALPPAGTAVDVCTGCGAIAAVLRAAHPRARVLGTDRDPAAAACAAGNGVEVRAGDLLDAVEPELRGRLDLVVGVVPYVPTGELRLLQRDTLTFESVAAYDGGDDGLDLARRVVAEAARWLAPGGRLLLELGGSQAALLRPALSAAGFGEPETLVDEDDDERGVSAALVT